MAALIKDKRTCLILCLLLVVLVVPRIAVYAALGDGLTPTDATARYFPQAEELTRSFSGFFSMTGPAYTAFLWLFKATTGNMVAGPVAVQHLLGVCTAILVFLLFRRVNTALALAVTVFTYSAVLSLHLEHSILRGSLAGFFMTCWVWLLIIGGSRRGWLYGALAALVGIILTLIRVEFAALLLLVPLILYIATKTSSPNGNPGRKNLLKWLGGYACLTLVFGAAYLTLPGTQAPAQTYGGILNIAWHTLQPEVFYYDDSEHPELLESYQAALESEAGYLTIDEEYFTVWRMIPFQEATREYLLRHPEFGNDMSLMMDRMYLEMMTKNPIVYAGSVAENLQSHLLGRGESISYLNTYEKTVAPGLSDLPWLNAAGRLAATSLEWVYSAVESLVFFWLFAAAFVLALFRWKRLPREVRIALMMSAVHLAVLAVAANASHRFRYPLDPLIYFTQGYLILEMLKEAFTRGRRLLLRHSPPGSSAE